MKTKAFLKSRDERKRVEMRFAHLKTHHDFEKLSLRAAGTSFRSAGERGAPSNLRGRAHSLPFFLSPLYRLGATGLHGANALVSRGNTAASSGQCLGMRLVMPFWAIQSMPKGE